MAKLFIELCKPPEQRQLNIFPRSIDEYFSTLLQCKEQNDRSLTPNQRRKRDRVDNLIRLKMDSWTEPTSQPLKKKQTMISRSGMLSSRPSGNMGDTTRAGAGKTQNGKRKTMLDMSLDQEPRPKRRAATDGNDFALIDPELLTL